MLGFPLGYKPISTNLIPPQTTLLANGTTQVILRDDSLWTVPTGLGQGAQLSVECWGGGSGAGATATNASGGAGGSYSDSPNYVISPHDLVNGIAFAIGQGSSGVGAANPLAGGTTTFGNNTNSIQCNTTLGVVSGTPGTLPGGGYNYMQYYNPGTLSTAISGFGTLSNGFPYCDFRVFGTAAGVNTILIIYQCTNVTASVSWTLSGKAAMVGGSLSNITSAAMEFDAYNGGTALTYDLINVPVSLTATLTNYSGSATTPATTNAGSAYLRLNYQAGSVDITIRLAGWQFEAGASQTYLKLTPGYTAAQGGGAPSGTTGGVGVASACICGYDGYSYAGGSGAAYNANGSGGGGSGGPDGFGANGTTVGQGGSADNASGGAGGAVATVSPGNQGGNDPAHGGGGGGGLKTASGSGGAGGAPGGGGGGSAVSGTGGAGVTGQIRITYTRQFPFVSRINRNFLLRR